MLKLFRKHAFPLIGSFILGLILLVLAAMEVPKMIKDYLQILPAYASVFIWIGLSLLILLEFYVGYRFGKKRGKDDAPTAAQHYNTLKEKNAEIETLKGETEKLQGELDLCKLNLKNNTEELQGIHQRETQPNATN